METVQVLERTARLQKEHQRNLLQRRGRQELPFSATMASDARAAEFSRFLRPNRDSARGPSSRPREDQSTSLLSVAAVDAGLRLPTNGSPPLLRPLLAAAEDDHGRVIAPSLLLDAPEEEAPRPFWQRTWPLLPSDEEPPGEEDPTDPMNRTLRRLTHSLPTEHLPSTSSKTSPHSRKTRLRERPPRSRWSPPPRDTPLELQDGFARATPGSPLHHGEQVV